MLLTTFLFVLIIMTKALIDKNCLYVLNVFPPIDNHIVCVYIMCVCMYVCMYVCERAHVCMHSIASTLQSQGGLIEITKPFVPPE